MALTRFVPFAIRHVLRRHQYRQFEHPTDSLQYDYALFASLTGFTEGTLKKFWPPVKKKVMDNHPHFSKFLTDGNPSAAPTAKATASKKRKAADADHGAEPESEAISADDADNKAFEDKTNKRAVKGKRGKKAKTDEGVVKQDENSANGGEGQFIYSQKVATWVENADGGADLA